MSHAALGPGREFDAVRRMEARWGARAAGLGDDAAVLDVPPGERLVVSTDSAIEGVHFRRDWLSPREIGWRATAAALSDLAAMGARPLGVVVALTVPVAWRDTLDDIADGIGDAVAFAETLVLGGDTSAGDALGVTVTVLGSATGPLLRSGARPGDRVYVTGALGGPLAALRDLEAGRTPTAENRRRFAHPEPRLREGAWLAAQGASAAVDISDGLAADLGHIAAASGVRIVVDLERVLVHEELDPRTGAWSAEDRLARPAVALLDAARSGEEYELGLTSPHRLDAAAFASRFGTALSEIGVVEAVAEGERAEVVLRLRGARVDLPAGHDHFSG